MKFNWGTGILIFIILFLLAISSFVFYSTTQIVNLVEDDYYPKELAYDKQMEKMRNYKNSDINIVIRKTSDHIMIEYKGLLPDDSLQGTVLIYRPSDYRKDIKIPMQINDTGYQFIARAPLLSGKYIIKFDWQSGQKTYYYEESFIND